MLSAILRSDTAVKVSIQIINAFVAMRRFLLSNILIDNYIDDTVLTLFSKRKKGISLTVLTKTVSKQMELDVKKYNEQFPKTEIKEFANSHDRFLIIDESTVYHLGASLKDLGKKWFAFSKMEIGAARMLARLEAVK